MNEEEYLKILGLSGEPTWVEIKNAFLKIAIKTHPDKGGKEEDFKKANAAYQHFRAKHEKAPHDSDTKSDHEKTVLFEKIVNTLRVVLGRINFFSKIAMWGGALVAVSGILIVILFASDSESVSFGIYGIIAAAVLFSSGKFVSIEKKIILSELDNLLHVKKHLAKTSIVSVVLALLISPLLLWGIPILGIFAVFYLLSIIYNTVKVYTYLNKYLGHDVVKSDSKRMAFEEIKRAVYPKVKHDIWWHRLISVIGWILSICSLWFIPVIFPLYFGLVQRIIYYVAYGDNKAKWMVILK